jgi:hypothetical protein
MMWTSNKLNFKRDYFLTRNFVKRWCSRTKMCWGHAFWIIKWSISCSILKLCPGFLTFYPLYHSSEFSQWRFFHQSPPHNLYMLITLGFIFLFLLHASVDANISYTLKLLCLKSFPGWPLIFCYSILQSPSSFSLLHPKNLTKYLIMSFKLRWSSG